MIYVSERATVALHNALEQSAEDNEQVLRIVREGEALGLRMDARRDGDEVTSHDGRDVLVVEPAISAALDGTTLDAVDSPDGVRLVLSAPEGDAG